MRLRDRFARLTLWNKLGALGSAASIVSLVGLVGLPLAVILYLLTPSPPELTGVLHPDTKPTPSNACTNFDKKISREIINHMPEGVHKDALKNFFESMLKDIPADALIVIVGNSAVYTTKFHYSVIEVSGKSLLAIDRSADGVFISASVFSRDGKIVAEIRKNKFSINPNNYFRIERPDKHNLIVYDQEATEVLHIYYINRTTMKVLGVFHDRSGTSVIVAEEVMTIRTSPAMPMYVGGLCHLSETHGPIRIFNN